MGTKEGMLEGRSVGNHIHTVLPGKRGDVVKLIVFGVAIDSSAEIDLNMTKKTSRPHLRDRKMFAAWRGFFFSSFSFEIVVEFSATERRSSSRL